MMLSSILADELPKYESSTTIVLLFPGNNGVPRALFVGLLKVVGVIFIAFSKATGRSLAPGGFLFLLGLP